MWSLYQNASKAKTRTNAALLLEVIRSAELYGPA